MADREERKIQASKHEALMKGAFAAETQAAVAATIVYEEGEGRELSIPEPAFESTETVVTKAFVPEAAYRYATGKTLIVDPAAFTRPGGAYEDGAFGPEQVICSESNLYQILCGLKETYHDKNRDYRRGMLCTDRAAYIPEVVFQHGGTMRKVDVLAISEPLRVRALENHRSERECDTALAARIETMLIRVRSLAWCLPFRECISMPSTPHSASRRRKRLLPSCRREISKMRTPSISLASTFRKA